MEKMNQQAKYLGSKKLTSFKIYCPQDPLLYLVH